MWLKKYAQYILNLISYVLNIKINKIKALFRVSYKKQKIN